MPDNKPKHVLEVSRKEGILQAIASALNRHEEIIVAYVFGSFIHRDAFSDIDVAILTAEHMDSTIDFELSLEIEIEDIVNYPIDVRVINRAP